MAEVKTVGEETAIEEIRLMLNIEGGGGGFWLGGAKVNNQWRWDHSKQEIPMKDDGEFNSWRTNEPNNRENENCLSFWRLVKEGHWTDDFCNHKRPFVCQYENGLFSFCFF